MTLRELDAMVAEKVLGWEPNQAPPDGFFCRTAGDVKGDRFAPVWWKTPVDWRCGVCDGVPPYSSDIAAAWEVVERLSLTEVFYMEVRNTIGGAVRVRLSFSDTLVAGTENEWGEIERKGEVIAATAPLAICLAALASVGITVNQTEVSDASRT
jgi:hypothetical protein